MRRPTIRELFLGGSVVLLLAPCLLGYGSDNDTYTVLDSGVSTWHLPGDVAQPRILGL